MSKAARDNTGLVVGGEARIDFLPPEVKEAKKSKRTRGSLTFLVIVVAAACVAGYVFSATLAAQSKGALEDEQTRTQQLLSEQGKYVEARTAETQIQSIFDARKVATSKEVLWKDFLTTLRASLASGMAITNVNVDSLAVSEEPPPLTGLLQQPRVATVTLTVTSPSLPVISTWLDSVEELTGYADFWVSSVTQTEEGYAADLQLNLNSDSYEKRFFEGYEDRGSVYGVIKPAPPEKKAPEDETAEKEASEDEGTPEGSETDEETNEGGN